MECGGIIMIQYGKLIYLGIYFLIYLLIYLGIYFLDNLIIFI
jgi:hypothetical protein